VRVNVISPGPIETSLYEKLGMDAGVQEKTIAVGTEVIIDGGMSQL
jgi:hypothetical protein